MAGNLKIQQVQLGDSATATNNFVLSVPASPDGTAKLSRGVLGATTSDVLNVGTGGVISFPSGVSIANGNTPTSVALPATIGNTNFTNSSGRAKFISFSAYGSAGVTMLKLTVAGVVVGTVTVTSGATGHATISYILPAGKTANFDISVNNTSGAYYTHIDL